MMHSQGSDELVIQPPWICEPVQANGKWSPSHYAIKEMGYVDVGCGLYAW